MDLFRLRHSEIGIVPADSSPLLRSCRLGLWCAATVYVGTSFRFRLLYWRYGVAGWAG